MRIASIRTVAIVALRVAGVVLSATYAISHEESKQAWLGVMLSEDDGAKVVGVVDGSAAAEAGVVQGDRIVAVDGAAVGSVERLIALIGDREPGDTVLLALSGDEGGEREVSATLGEKTARSFSFAWSGEHGVDLHELPLQLQKHLKGLGDSLAPLAQLEGLKAEPRGFLGVSMIEPSDALRRALGGRDGIGVLVNDVTEGSAAEEAGVEAGDLLVAIDGENVHSVHDLTRMIRSRDPGTGVRIEAIRDEGSMTFDATLGESQHSFQFLNRMLAPDAISVPDVPMHFEFIEQFEGVDGSGAEHPERETDEMAPARIRTLFGADQV